MVLSYEEELKIVKNYEQIAWRTVRRFMKSGTVLCDLEDLHSECMVVLIEHLRSVKRKEDIYRLQVMDLVNAMSRYLMKKQMLSVGVRTTSMHKLIDAMPKSTTMDVAATRGEVKMVSREPIRVNFTESEVYYSGLIEDTVPTIIDYRDFCDGLDEREKFILKQRQEGNFDKEIAVKLGVSPRRVGAIADRVRDRYKKYIDVA